MKIFARILCLAAIAVYAQDIGLKDVYANYFRFGNILNGTTVNNAAMKNLVLKEFNSITPENELKPDATLVQNGSTNTDVKVQLNNGAKNILKFCEDNNIPVRGHTLVWHSQTPGWFFRENFNANGNVVSKDVMNQRMESYIKNMFKLIKDSYPKLNLYAYDVVNEAASESGSYRTPGTDAGSGQSMWVEVYGDNSFVKKAFEYARLYAPATTKLFYNDYNEYITAKMNYIANSIVKPLFDEGLLDGMGMQSHLDARSGNNAYPSATTYGQAIKKYKDIGVEIHVTELDATVDESNFSAQATYYKNIMEAIIDKGGDAVTAVVVWGIQDNQSWRKDRNPLLFNSSGEKKEAYNSIVALVPESQWGKPPANGSGEVIETCGEYQKSFCGGMAFSSVKSGSTTMPSEGECLFIGDFEAIQPDLNSTVSINGVENTCGNAWGNCDYNSKPSAKDGGYYVYVKDGSINVYKEGTEPNGWKGIVAKAKPDNCETTPIITKNIMPQTLYSIKYYTLKGEPLGNRLPSKSGVYIAREGYSVKKIVVK